MIGGITTYLIIYIQFYALYGKDESGNTVHRNNEAISPGSDSDQQQQPTRSADAVASRSFSRNL